MLHIHVFFAAPLITGYITQSGTNQHKSRVSIRERTYNSRCQRRKENNEKRRKENDRNAGIITAGLLIVS